MLRSVAALFALALAAGALTTAAEPTWGAPVNSLRLGLSRDSPGSPDLLVSFSNTAPVGSPPLLVLLGGRSGSGPHYTIEFTAMHPHGDSCRLLNSLGGVGVAGYVAPILVSIAAGATYAIRIPFENLFCVRDGQSTGLERLLALGYSVQATFTTKPDDIGWARAPTAWVGEVRSRPFAAGPRASQ